MNHLGVRIHAQLWSQLTNLCKNKGINLIAADMHRKAKGQGWSNKWLPVKQLLDSSQTHQEDKSVSSSSHGDSHSVCHEPETFSAFKPSLSPKKQLLPRSAVLHPTNSATFATASFIALLR
mmetsp:Transcript_12145/g.22929  ORF Transcript_12145/g.22929 Transcript_12145/m.22929 type:complete len:121 (+) Transcript_12145:274-636(+)